MANSVEFGILVGLGGVILVTALAASSTILSEKQNVVRAEAKSGMLLAPGEDSLGNHVAYTHLPRPGAHTAAALGEPLPKAEAHAPQKSGLGPEQWANR